METGDLQCHHSKKCSHSSGNRYIKVSIRVKYSRLGQFSISQSINQLTSIAFRPIEYGHLKKMRVRAYYNPCPGPIGLSSILVSTQILAWPENLAWPKIWPLNFFFTSFFQNSDLFCDVLIMISMID